MKKARKRTIEFYSKIKKPAIYEITTYGASYLDGFWLSRDKTKVGKISMMTYLIMRLYNKHKLQDFDGYSYDYRNDEVLINYNNGLDVNYKVRLYKSILPALLIKTKGIGITKSIRIITKRRRRIIRHAFKKMKRARNKITRTLRKMVKIRNA